MTDSKIITFPDRWKPEKPRHKIDWANVTRHRRINGRMVEVDWQNPEETLDASGNECRRLHNARKAQETGEQP